MSVSLVGTISGVTTAVWGAANIGTTTSYGTVVRCAVTKRAKQKPRLSNVGETVGVTIYDQSDEVELDVECNDAATLPAVGDAIQVDGLSGVVVTQPQRLWDREDYKKFRIRGTKWSAMTIS